MKIQTYKEWLKEWINVYKKPFVKNWRKIQRCIDLHIPRSIQNHFLCNLTAFDIQKALNGVKSSRMRLETFDIYHGSLSMAYKVGIINRDIASALIKPKHVRKVGCALTSSEVSAFLASVRNCRLKYYYMFLLLTGCRRSEALSVTWRDIDFGTNRIHIRGTKTETSDRFIPIFPELAELLEKIPYKGDKLFYHYPNYVTRTFKKLCPEHKLHDLRHTFATRCLECGISLKVVQSWLGHSRLDTTATIYSHLLPDFLQSESAKFKLL